jgi:hypothetical protein
MLAAQRPMRRLNARSPTSVVSFHVPLRMGSCVRCRAHRTRHSALISRLASTRLRTMRGCVWTYTLGKLRNLLPPSQNLPLLYSRQAATQSPEFSPAPVPPPRRAHRRSQPSPTRTAWCTPLPPLYTQHRCATPYSMPPPTINPLEFPDLTAITYPPSEDLLPPSRAVDTACAAGTMSAAAVVQAVGSGRGCPHRCLSHRRSQPHPENDLNRPQPRARAQRRTAAPYRSRNATAAARSIPRRWRPY